MVIILVIGILSGSFLAPNHDSNLYIVYPFLMDLLIGEYLPLRPMNWHMTDGLHMWLVSKVKVKKKVNIFTRKLPAIHFAFVLFTPIKCRACTVPEVQVYYLIFLAFYKLEFNASHTVTFLKKFTLKIINAYFLFIKLNFR